MGSQNNQYRMTWGENRYSATDIRKAQDEMERNMRLAQIIDTEKRLLLAQQRQRDLSTVISSETTVMGKFLVNGSGEGYKDIKFPIAFGNVPLITFGFEIQDDEARSTSESFSGIIVKGKAPIITAAVYGWEIWGNPPYDRKFLGAKILSTCEGPLTTKYMVHWMAAGVALEGPSVESGNSAGASTETDYRRAAVQWVWKVSAGWYEGNWYTANQIPPGVYVAGV